jgi:hypothetical protein
MRLVPILGGEGSGVTEVAAMPPRSLRGALALTAVLGVVGLVLGLQAIVSPPHVHPVVVREPPSATAWRATASFGPVAAERVERSEAHLFTAHHGSTNARSDTVVVSVRVQNRSARALPFSSGEFRLEAVGPGTTVTPIDPNRAPGVFGAGSTLRTDVSFLVPVAYQTFALVFQDASASRSVRIPLGVIPAPKA